MDNSGASPAAEHRPHILLVEDEPAIRRLFAASFNDFNLIIAHDVAHAREVLERMGNRIAVLIADHYLPDGTGVEVLVSARQRWPDTVRLLTTSRADLGQAMEAVNEAGISGFITKPWALDDLRATLSRSIASWSSQRHERELLAGKRETLMALASSIAHEMRTPLTTVRLSAQAMARHWPMLVDLYREAVADGRVPPMRAGRLEQLAASPDVIEQEVNRTNLVIEMLLASANAGKMDASRFAVHTMSDCVHKALGGYPFPRAEKDSVRFDEERDFMFFGSDALVIFILYNLLKNALHAIARKGAGAIDIRMTSEAGRNVLSFRDSGAGISPNDLPKIFDDFYTTKEVGTGVGLSFCRSAMRSMGGDIRCASVEGEFTLFTLVFPAIDAPD